MTKKAFCLVLIFSSSRVGAVVSFLQGLLLRADLAVSSSKLPAQHPYRLGVQTQLLMPQPINGSSHG